MATISAPSAKSKSAVDRSMSFESDELRRRLAELEVISEEVDDEITDAEDVRAEAQDTLAAATREREAADAALQRLRRD